MGVVFTVHRRPRPSQLSPASGHGWMWALQDLVGKNFLHAVFGIPNFTPLPFPSEKSYCSPSSFIGWHFTTHSVGVGLELMGCQMGPALK